MKKRVMIALLAVVAGLFALPGWAQTTIIKGKVLDDAGKPLAGAIVELTNNENGRKYSLKTDSKGQYFQVGVTGGTYDIKLIKDNNTLATFNKYRVSLSEQENVFDIDLRQQKQAAEQQLSPEEKAKREAALKENQKIAGLNNMLAAAATAQQSGNYDEAVRILKEATTTDTTHDLLWAKLGDALLASGKHAPATERAKATETFTQAIDAYKKAIDIKPTVGAYYNNLGEAYARVGKTQEAIQQYQLAAQNDPPNAAKYYFNLGAVLTNSGKVDDANNAFDKAIAANPEYAEAYYQKAVNLIGKAKVDEKTGTMVAPPEVATNLNKYLELAPTGPNSQAAKDLLASLGAKVETSFGKGKTKPATKK